MSARVFFIGAIFFFVCALYYKRLADYLQKGTGHSDNLKLIGISIMRPLLFVFSAITLIFAYMFFTGRG